MVEIYPTSMFYRHPYAEEQELIRKMTKDIYAIAVAFDPATINYPQLRWIVEKAKPEKRIEIIRNKVKDVKTLLEEIGV
ncbi:MAG: hypothetical protein DRJ35_08330 [Thermoprotei archaeon]|nr:MAG: hypothetical protein DRJ35_08330 [Thermoprotei archaeon]